MNMKKRKGFTIVELLLSFAIFTIISLAVFSVYQVGLSSWDTVSAQTHVSAEARTAVEKMNRELRKSRLSNVNTSQANQICFKTPSTVDSNGNITAWSNWVRYSRGGVNGNQLLREVQTTSLTNCTDVGGSWSSSSVLANNITNVQFATTSSPATVTETVTAQETTLKGFTVPVSLSSAVELRN